MAPTLRTLALGLIGLAGAILGTAVVQSVQAAKRPASNGGAVLPATPEILLNAQNRVPACIDPDRFDQLLAERNPRLDARFRGIARLYKSHGEKIGVRWDYAFYQMILETNSLKFTGDVRARQNNFAGLGATGGGVPGESFPDVSTGVLAQLQHLVAYAGTRVDNPVAKRTRENQDDIIAKSKRLGRPVRFADLTNRWAADGRYARSIDTLASLFKSASCQGREAVAEAPTASPAPAASAVPTAVPKQRRDAARKSVDKAETPRPSGLGAAPTAAATDQPSPQQASAPACSVMAASFGGAMTLLIRAAQPGRVTFTALGVDEVRADAMAASYIATHAPGGTIAGRFPSQDDAVARAYQLCDSGRP
jgi:hypothetical protein